MHLEWTNFNLKYKKQILLMIFLSFIYQQHGKFKLSLKFISSAQKLASELDQGYPRNNDYILAVNIMTALVLIKIGKPTEALEFLQIAEKAIH